MIDILDSKLFTLYECYKLSINYLNHSLLVKYLVYLLEVL